MTQPDETIAMAELRRLVEDAFSRAGMAAGEVVFDGTAKEVLENESLRHEYLAI